VRNSLLPIAAAVAVLAIGVILIRPTVDRGQGGPEVNPGILRLPKRNPLRTVSMDLAGSTAAAIESGGRDDGLWRVVVIRGGDRQPTTRAAMLAAGEVLFTAGCLVVMDPPMAVGEPSPPLPIPADRVLRIATRAGVDTRSLDGTWVANVEFRLWEPRLPGGHPAEPWQPPPTAMSTVCVVEHRGRPAAGGQGGWPERWAATGRTLVQAALGALVPAGGVAVPPGRVATAWDSPLPAAPSTPELHWDACFQYDFVRGWSGSIPGRSVSTSTGGSEPAVAPLERLLISGRWRQLADAAPWRLWNRAKDGTQQWFGLREQGGGWDATMWIEQPSATDLITAWIAAAGRGDAAASEHLRRSAGVLALPAELHQRAAAALR